MSKKRLNDTIAVKAMMPSTPQDYQHMSKTIRKIDNGFVTSTYSDGKSTETFSSESPGDFASGEKGGELTRDTNAMKRAVDFMNKC